MADSLLRVSHPADTPQVLEQLDERAATSSRTPEPWEADEIEVDDALLGELADAAIAEAVGGADATQKLSQENEALRQQALQSAGEASLVRQNMIRLAQDNLRLQAELAERSAANAAKTHEMEAELARRLSVLDAERQFAAAENLWAGSAPAAKRVKSGASGKRPAAVVSVRKALVVDAARTLSAQLGDDVAAGLSQAVRDLGGAEVAPGNVCAGLCETVERIAGPGGEKWRSTAEPTVKAILRGHADARDARFVLQALQKALEDAESPAERLAAAALAAAHADAGWAAAWHWGSAEDASVDHAFARALAGAADALGSDAANAHALRWVLECATRVVSPSVASEAPLISRRTLRRALGGPPALARAAARLCERFSDCTWLWTALVESGEDQRPPIVLLAGPPAGAAGVAALAAVASSFTWAAVASECRPGAVAALVGSLVASARAAADGGDISALLLPLRVLGGLGGALAAAPALGSTQGTRLHQYLARHPFQAASWLLVLRHSARPANSVVSARLEQLCGEQSLLLA